MPVNFLTKEQQDGYGRFVDDPSTEDLEKFFYLDERDKALITKRRGSHNKLGFSTVICTVRYLGSFIEAPSDTPKIAVKYLARQLEISSPLLTFRKYSERSETYFEHVSEIKKEYGYQDLHNSRFAFKYSRWIYTRNWLSYERPSVLFDLSINWLRQRNILLPGISKLTRLISRVRDRVSEKQWKLLSSLPNDKQIQNLESLLSLQPPSRNTLLEQLRRPPSIISSNSLVSALNRVEKFKKLGIDNLDLSIIPPARRYELSRFASVARAQAISRMPSDRRISTLLSFADTYHRLAIDDAIDVFDLLMTELSNKASHTNKKNRYRTLKDLDKAARDLSKACKILLDDHKNPQNIRETIFSKIEPEILLSAVSTVETITRPPEDTFQEELILKYNTIRRFITCLLSTLTFYGVSSAQPILDAIQFLKLIEGNKKLTIHNAPCKFIPKSWKRYVFIDKVSLDRKAYTLCVVTQLQIELKRRNIFVGNSARWNDPRIKILHGKEWFSLRPHISRTLGRDLTPEKEVEKLSHQLDFEFKKTLDGLNDNPHARFENINGQPELVLSRIEKLEENESLKNLKNKIEDLIPNIDLPEAILEIHERTGFLNEFTHIGQNESRVQDIHISLGAVLLAEACNIGLEPVIQKGNPALSKDRLSWVKQNHIRIENITKSNAKLVHYQKDITFAQAIGGGEVASADGLRFVSPVKSLHSGFNRKYFNKHRGVTYYNFLSDQDMGFNGIPIPGTLRDSMFILEGILEHETCLDIKEVHTDMAGYSDVVFGLFWLLGYRFCPRITDIGNKRFWRINPNADYGDFNHISKNNIRLNRIFNHWDDFLRIAGSLKMGTVSASELVRSLLNTRRPSEITKGIMDLGRINKTIQALQMINDESHRRRSITQLNRQESRHSLARELFHGKRGELRQKYREGQEDQLGALGLVLNVLVLWNTIYIDAAIKKLKADGMRILDEDIARLSPIRWENFNFLGRYSFILDEIVKQGKLRNLRVNQDENVFLA